MDVGFDPHAYTSGRWLRNDKLERQARFTKFNFDALCRKVLALCPGASSIVSYDKKEGGFNRVFIFHTDNAQRLVAKLPFSLAGPRRLTTSSEVATIKYLQAKTGIPIPSILDWSDDADSTIGSEYIIMEHAPGVNLTEKWPSMDAGDQIKCIEAIYQKLKEMANLDFPAYGSLYLAEKDHKEFSVVPIDDKINIGPHCGSMYWNCSVVQPQYYHKVAPNQGPWSGFTSYCDGLIDVGLSKLPKADRPRRPRYQGSVQTHHNLLEHGRMVIKKMAAGPRIVAAATPMLFHPDLHKRNIFVSEEDPTVISSIIDWQSTSIEPAFWHADEVPDFAKAIPDPNCEDEIDPKSEACAKANHVCIQFLIPKLARAKAMDENLFRPFRYCYRTWEDGAAAFREELIQTARHWNELGFSGSCPYPVPSGDELADHQKDYRLFEAAHQLRYSLADLLNTASDGWVPWEEWEKTESAHEEMFYGMLQEITQNKDPDDDEPIRTESDLRSIWPFDLK